ncbi:coenzyme F420-0:L-glutamate ligase [Actinoplanes sp. Pm04-4]|uniref:Coenzyme F420-0:L-glutamate ligase n=1 Tax=Paractinoplanes pyxinae TaxID=2997416 RepID=A0ABT4B8W4_9ACTN|nr:coenzyme F420-0:L-glutamate ligase [Actinoplanes pyxinae]MCY1142916.1 coenzyme F420-0:L-glutamate ligase [Actinoplanes pyxinae]
MTDGLEILPVRGIGEIVAGDDLAEVITAAAPWLADGDVLVVTSKIVSKAEGRLVEVPVDGEERDQARAAVLESETARVVARRGPTTIVQTHHGFVMAAAGIDNSNVDRSHVVLLPTDPDASARRLRDDLLKRGLDVGVIVSDTMGRAWRNGQTDVALGAAGIEPIRDHRGETDPYGNELEITQIAVIDELAAAGELVKGKIDQTPVAVVRGYPRSGIRDTDDASVLLRDAASDMFGLGTAEARADGLRQAAQLPDGPEAALPGNPVDPAAVDRAAAAVADYLSRATTVAPAEAVPGSGATAAFHLSTLDKSPTGFMHLGADAHRFRAALAAESIATLSLPHEDGIRLELSGT